MPSNKKKFSILILKPNFSARFPRCNQPTTGSKCKAHSPRNSCVAYLAIPPINRLNSCNHKSMSYVGSWSDFKANEDKT